MPRESCTNESRSWEVTPLKFVARLKHKVNKKVNEYFISQFFPDESSAPPPQPWSGAHDGGQFPYHNEASSSNHTSAPNSQCFDAREYLQQHQIIPPPSSANCNMGTSAPGDVGTPMSVDMDESSDAVMEMQSSQDPSHLRRMLDELSTDDTAETDTTDTGNSTFTGRGNSTFTGRGNPTTYPSESYILPPQPVHPPRCTAIRKFLTVREVKRILFEEDAPSRFRVAARFVYACRTFKTLLQRRRSRCTPPSIIIPTSPMVSGASSSRMGNASPHSSRVYQGVKERKGKWVAEIRVSKTLDKVWLGSFPLEKQAALAYDLGLHHCSVKRNKVFNFRESPARLGPSQYAGLLPMDREDRKVAVQNLAWDYAMAFGGS